MQQLFEIAYFISLVLVFACVLIVGTQRESYMQKLTLLMSIVVLIGDVAFYFKVTSHNLGGMAGAQLLIYASLPYCVFFVLLFLLKFCEIKMNKIIKISLHIVNVILSVFVITNESHHLFYKDLSMRVEDGFYILDKVYGPVHHFMTAAIFMYYAALLCVVIYFSIKNYKQKKKTVLKLIIAVIIPFVAYVAPKIFDSPYEYHPLGFSLFLAILVGMVYSDSLYDVSNIASQYIFKSLDEAMVVFDNNYHFKGCNEKAYELFPYLKGFPLNGDIRNESGDFADYIDEKVKEFMEDEIIYEVSVRLIGKAGKVIGKVIRFSDVTVDRIYTSLLKEQKKSLESEVVNLSNISYHDEITGLFNRRYYEDILSQIRNGEAEPDYTVIAIDVNGLKKVNDNVGHSAGDELICGAAGILDDCFSKIGSVCRIGGDEFAVILFNCGFSNNEIKNIIETRMREWHGRMVDSLSMSFGIVRAFDYPSDNIDKHIIIADQLMYEYKRNYYNSLGIDRRKR